jgi:hypothetical protein
MKAGLVAALFLLSSFIPARAEWQEDGTPVSTGGGHRTQVAAVSDGTGGAYLAWATSEQSGDIYAQRLNAAGVAQWTENGVAICSHSSAQSAPSIVMDASGGVFIAWHDWRNDATANQDIYVQRVTSAGETVFTANGIVLTGAVAGQHYPIMVSDGAGGIVAAWLDSRNGSLNSDVYGARMTSTGARPDGANGIAISTAVSNQSPSSILPYANGGAIVAWTDARGGVPDVYAARVSNAGVVLDATGIPICAIGGEQTYPALVPDGAGGAIVTFCDGGRMGEVYAQRINSAGAVQWTPNGVVVGKADLLTSIFQQPKTVSDGAGGAILSWERFDGSDINIYAQRIDGAGVTQWNANSVPVCNASGNQTWVVITSDTQGGAVVGWSDPRAFTNGGDIYAQRLSPGGASLWAPNGEVLCDEPLDQSSIAIVSDMVGGAILAWADKRFFFQTDIYANRLGPGGHMPTGASALPGAVSLGVNYPNPFDSRTAISFSLASRCRVTLRIYGVSGELVATLLDEECGPGQHVARWDGRDASGGASSTGIYFARLDSGGASKTLKMVLLK